MVDQHYDAAEEAAYFDNEELTRRRNDLLNAPNLVADYAIRICDTTGGDFNEKLLFDQTSTTITRHLAPSLHIIEQEMIYRGLNPGAEE